MDLDVVFLGTAGSAPTARRGLPATLVRRGGERILFDCGEGTQRQMLRSVGLVDLEEIFITHFHADHILGLPGMLKTFALRGREAPLEVHGPPGLEQVWAKALQPLVGRTPFELTLTELAIGTPVERDGWFVAPYPADHGTRAFGYAVVEHDRPGRFDEARARELGVREGPDFGRLQRGETVVADGGATVSPDEVLGESRPGRKVVLAGDGMPGEATAVAAYGADLLVHEATFGHEDAARAKETHHSTARGAAELAGRAEVGLLALTHLSQRYAGPELRDEAREVFERTIVPRDFDSVEIPFPERGAPVHVHHDRRAPAPAG